MTHAGARGGVDERRTVQRPPSWWAALTDRAVLVRSCLTCLVVGVILTVIHHGSELSRGEVGADLAWQVPLTFLVPFLVATISSAATIRSRDRQAGRTSAVERSDPPADAGGVTGVTGMSDSPLAVPRGDLDAD